MTLIILIQLKEDIQKDMTYFGHFFKLNLIIEIVEDFETINYKKMISIFKKFLFYFSFFVFTSTDDFSLI